jgi:hypothetical protein
VPDAPPAPTGPTDSLSAQTRLNRTWDDVYNTPYPSLAALPWYTVAGQVDWAGNVSGAYFSLLRPGLEQSCRQGCSQRQIRAFVVSPCTN